MLARHGPTKTSKRIRSLTSTVHPPPLPLWYSRDSRGAHGMPLCITNAMHRGQLTYNCGDSACSAATFHKVSTTLGNMVTTSIAIGGGGYQV